MIPIKYTFEVQTKSCGHLKCVAKVTWSNNDESVFENPKCYDTEEQVQHAGEQFVKMFEENHHRIAEKIKASKKNDTPTLH